MWQMTSTKRVLARAALPVTGVGVLTVAACGGGSSADPASFEVMVAQMPHEDEAPPLVYFNVERLREAGVDGLDGSIEDFMRSDDVFEVTGGQLTIGEPFRRQMATFGGDDGSPLQLADTSATLENYRGVTLLAGDYDADRVDDDLAAATGGELQRGERDGWQTFDVEPGDASLDGLPDGSALAMNDDQAILAGDSDVLEMVLELDSDARATSIDGIEEVAAEADDLEAFTAALLIEPDWWEGRNGDDDAPSLPRWDRAVAAASIDDNGGLVGHTILWYSHGAPSGVDETAAGALQEVAECRSAEATIDGNLVVVSCPTDVPVVTHVLQYGNRRLLGWTADG